MTSARARPAAADTGNRLLGYLALDVAGVDTLRQIIVDTGALQAIESQVASLVEQSRRALREGRFTAEARSALDALITAPTSLVA